MYAAASLIILGSAPLLYIGDSTPQPTYPMLMPNTNVVLQSKLNHQSFCLTSESFSPLTKGTAFAINSCGLSCCSAIIGSAESSVFTSRYIRTENSILREQASKVIPKCMQ